jgi:hypothetical protein
VPAALLAPLPVKIVFLSWMQGRSVLDFLPDFAVPVVAGFVCRAVIVSRIIASATGRAVAGWLVMAVGTAAACIFVRLGFGAFVYGAVKLFFPPA